MNDDQLLEELRGLLGEEPEQAAEEPAREERCPEEKKA